jgi:hypothetical protein
MNDNRPPPRALDTSILLRRGHVQRQMTLTLTVRCPEDEPRAAERALAAFLRAVDAELFGPPAPPGPPMLAHTVEHDRAGDVAVYKLRALFPRMPPEGFAVLARMVERSVPHAIALAIHEDAREAPLTLRRFEPRDTDVTLADVPWRVALPVSGPPGVAVEFAEEPGWHALHLVLERLEAWIDVVARGGFPGPGAEPFSRAVVQSKGQLTDRCMGLRLGELACAHDAVESLYQGLLSVHEHASIESVSVTSGPREAPPLPRALRATEIP